MMIHVMSDIHFEHMHKEDGDEFFNNLENLLKNEPADVAVLAGDICQIGKTERFWKSTMARLCGYYNKVIYIPGNHEYYRSSFKDADLFLNEVNLSANFSNLINLDYGHYEYKNQRFIGGTMWFQDNQESRFIKRMMNDFNVISDFEPEVYERHSRFLNSVVHSLKPTDIVVSHHLPLPNCIDSIYEGSPLNQFFMTDISNRLDENNLPKLWIHGHTHVPVDFKHNVGVNAMRVYCNPYGYPGEGSNLKFWERTAIEI